MSVGERRDTLESKMVIKTCFIGGARYRQPLDRTAEKKFCALKPLGDLIVIGFSQSLRPRRFTEHARFYLLPMMPSPVVRYVEMFVLGPFLALWLILRHGVQVLVAQSPYEGFPAALAKKVGSWFGCNVALVVESHGDFEESLFMQRRMRLARWYRFLMVRVAAFTLENADVLRAVSHSTKAQLERWIPGKPLVQFPTWTDIEVFLQAGLNKEFPRPQNILYAGVLIPRKGGHHLINAFARVVRDFPDARLVLVGHAENKQYTSELEDQVSRQGLDERVDFIGGVSQADLAGWMRRAWVFALPTYSEGLPRVVFEAMAAGLPVVSSSVSGIPEVVENGVTGFLVPPGDETALAVRLRWILEHPDEAQEMGRRARAFAESFFSTAAYTAGYQRIFKLAQALLSPKRKHAHSSL
jgi:glycosyltransferase involved in cell wall biosynthesis